MYQHRCVAALRPRLHEAMFVRAERARAVAVDYLRTLVDGVRGGVVQAADDIGTSMLPMPEETLADRYAPTLPRSAPTLPCSAPCPMGTHLLRISPCWYLHTQHKV